MQAVRACVCLPALCVLVALAGCSKPKAASPAMAWIPRHADWPDGETSYYDVSRNDTITGRTCFRIERATQNGKAVYRMTGVNNAFAMGINLLHDSITATLTGDSLKPLNCFQVRSLATKLDTVISRYEPGRVILSMSEGHTETLAAPENTFDNSILTMAIRSLDLKPGAKYLLTSVASFGPWTKPADIAVVGEDTITVPAGTFVCNRIALEIAGTMLNLWYEKDEPRRYVRFENPAGNSAAVLARYEAAAGPAAR